MEVWIPSDAGLVWLCLCQRRPHLYRRPSSLFRDLVHPDAAREPLRLLAVAREALVLRLDLAEGGAPVAVDAVEVVAGLVRRDVPVPAPE